MPAPEATLALAPARGGQLVRVATGMARAGVLTFAGALPISIAAMQIGLGVAAGGLLLARAAGLRAFRRSALDLPVLLLTGAAVLSVAVAVATGIPPASPFRATLWKTLLTPLVVIAALELAPPGEDPGAPRRRALAALALWSAGALVTGAVSAVQPWTGLDPLAFAHTAPIRATAERAAWPGHFHASGFFGAQYTLLPLALVPPLAVALATAALAPLEPWQRRLLAAGGAAAVLASLLSLTRSTWLALGAVALTVLLASGRRARATIARAAALPLLALAVPGVRQRVQNGLSLAANADRLLIWRVCGEVRRDHPWTGVGFGNFGSIAGPYFDRASPGWLVRTGCHDATLSFLVEGGPLLLGASLLYWGLLVATFVRARRDAARRGDALGSAGAAAGLAAVAGAFANTLFLDPFHVSFATYAMGLAFGVAAVLSRAPAASASA